MSGRLDELVREAREDLGRPEVQEVDWHAVDRGLFERIEREKRAERAHLLSGRGRRWGLAAAALAVAAAIPLVAGKTRTPRSLDAVQAAVEDGAGAVLALDGDGQLLVNGSPAAIGTPLRRDDVIEAHGVQATIERTGKVTFVIERDTRATVEHVQGALVLALAEGAIEAQVVPVASGEAFAVDVGRSRVAVHGTHLRVARHGEQVVIDLNEGVVSVGEAPRVGSTLGALVTAPAHAEFGASAAEKTLAVTHNASLVRAPVALGPTARIVAARAPVPVSPAPPAAELHPAAAPVAAAAHAEPHPASPAPPATAAAAPATDPDAESTIASAVRACMAGRTHATDVTVVVSTTLHLEVADDGSVRAARFDPPVAADVNTCAAPSIYKTRFAHGGAVAIPVDVKVPSSAP